MKKSTLIAIAALALGIAGCSQTQLDTANRNFLATFCANGQMILSQVPTGFLPPATIQSIHDTACSTAFGTVPAPTPAVGMGPVFPPPAAPVVSAPPASVVGGPNGH